MEQEIWRDVVGYEGIYLISSIGMLKGIDRVIKMKDGRSFFRKGRNITVRKTNFGYYDTRLCKNGGKKSVFLHRIIAEAFIPNPDNLPMINHINGIKTDNRIENLEWVSASGNSKHAYDNGLKKNPRHSHRQVIDTCTNRLYASIREAATANNIRIIIARIF